MKKDFLYILLNKLNTAYCKIGVSNNVENRIKSIYGEWILYEKIKTSDAMYYEKIVKNKLSDFAVCGYEMFNCPVEYLKKVVYAEMSKMIEVELPQNAKVVEVTTTNIGRTIKNARKKQNLTQKQLAKICKCGTRFIIELEKGKKTCEVDIVLRVINQLKLKLFIA